MGVFGSIQSETRECAFPNGDALFVNVFVNYAAARAFAAFAADTVYSILGAVTRSDGGEGLFYYNATSTAADNGGTVLRPNNIAAGSPGRLIRLIL
jgi:hypothetical protein